VAAIDVGSNAVRMAVAQLRSGGKLEVLEELKVPIAIGADSFREGSIGGTTTQRVAQALLRFREVLSTYGVERYRAVATTAVRDAANRDVFIDRVARLSGIPLEVIEAIEETRLLYQSVHHRLGGRLAPGGGAAMVLSLGAGSTEIIVVRGDEILLAETLQLGTLRLVQADPSRPAPRAALEAMVGKLARSLVHTRDLPPMRHLVVLSGPLMRLLRAGLEGPTAHEDLLVLRRRPLLTRCLELELISAETLAAKRGLSLLDAQTALVAVVELRCFLEATHPTTVTFPDVSTLTGMLLEAGQPAGSLAAARPVTAQIHSAALSVGRKYRFDEPHARQVERLALSLFDSLGELCGLDERSRVLLSVAALLHDIGVFVSNRAHHRHSAYLIENSEILGLDQRELHAAATVARLHRKRFAPDAELAALASLHRVEIVKLAAILRVADALDRDHHQLVDSVRAEATDGTVVLKLRSRHPTRAALAVIESSVRQKGDLFRDTFGLALQTREELDA
jgi:exopolyphosphatase/guanosine-5'-triphosphate,3'-diphosphate pyrophosphatase